MAFRWELSLFCCFICYLVAETIGKTSTITAAAVGNTKYHSRIRHKTHQKTNCNKEWLLDLCKMFSNRQ